jgi:hypothetical protein
VKTSSRIPPLGLFALLLLAAAGASAAAPHAPACTAAPGPTAQAALPGLLQPGVSQPIPMLTCGPGFILGTYTAYYSDPAKTMYVCQKSCGDTDCTHFTPYFTTSQTCCPRIH